MVLPGWTSFNDVYGENAWTSAGDVVCTGWPEQLRWWLLFGMVWHCWCLWSWWLWKDGMILPWSKFWVLPHVIPKLNTNIYVTTVGLNLVRRKLEMLSSNLPDLRTMSAGQPRNAWTCKSVQRRAAQAPILDEVLLYPTVPYWSLLIIDEAEHENEWFRAAVATQVVLVISCTSAPLLFPVFKMIVLRIEDWARLPCVQAAKLSL